MARKEAIRTRLEGARRRRQIRSYECVGNRPGLHWILEGYGSFSTRVYTTNEVEVFLTGCETVYNYTQERDNDDQLVYYTEVYGMEWS